MADTDLILSQSDLLELADAVKVIEKHYPDRELRLVLRNGSANGHSKPTSETPPRGQKTRGKRAAGGNRQKVAEATRGRWATMQQIIAETGLTKIQIHGAMLGKDGPYVFDRRLVEDGAPNGPKEYRLHGT